MGRSLGGYSVFQALTLYPSLYAFYGIGSLKGLPSNMHKFQVRYMDTLVFKDGVSQSEI
jgi:hypothetical protein